MSAKEIFLTLFILGFAYVFCLVGLFSFLGWWENKWRSK